VRRHGRRRRHLRSGPLNCTAPLGFRADEADTSAAGEDGRAARRDSEAAERREVERGEREREKGCGVGRKLGEGGGVAAFVKGGGREEAAQRTVGHGRGA
jgi:hypothetical protein